ncbi:MAG: hypothetical protein NVS3B20_15430 [Polyangiales bacterium]
MRARSFLKPVGAPGHRKYPPHRTVLATVFWVGEPPTKENGCMANFTSAFDYDWIGGYGGCDGGPSRVQDRDGFNRPAGFTPAENPYYFALPYGTNDRAPWREEIPWLEDCADARSIRHAVKNRWIGVRSGERICYGQWEDVGPFCADDVEYVMGYAGPRNDGSQCDTDAKGTGTKSGLDLSPAMSLCLGHQRFDMFEADWWFVDDADVPNGPWKKIVTTSPVRDGVSRPTGRCIDRAPFPACPG